MESRICQTLEVSPAEPKEFPTYLFGLDIDQYEDRDYKYSLINCCFTF